MNLYINDVFLPHITNTNRYLVLWGGAGSGKSVFSAQKIVLRIISERNHRILVCRKVGNTISESIFKEIIRVIDSFGIRKEFEINKTEKKFTHKPTGNQILCTGLDDPEKLKSISGISTIWIEEATEFDQGDIDQLDTRLRSETGNYKQVIISFNPVDENHWIKAAYFPKESDGQKEYSYTKEVEYEGAITSISVTLLHSTFKDNQFINQAEYNAVLTLKADSNPNFYRIYRDGQWGKAKVERQWAHNFNSDIHVSQSAIYDPKKPVYFSFDFNVDPFVCNCFHIWTDKEGHHFHGFREIALNNGDVPQMASRIKELFPATTWANGYFTGDATARKKEIVHRDNLSAWMVLTRELKISKTRLQVPRANPIVRENRVLVNSVLALHPDFKLNPSMTITVKEFQFTESDEEGNIMKTDRQNIKQRADGLDNTRYAINTWMFDFIDKPHRYYKP